MKSLLATAASHYRTAALLVPLAAATLLGGPPPGVAAAAPPQAVAAAAPRAMLTAPQDRYRWIGPDLTVLPLTDEQVIEFLREAPVIDSEDIDIGVNGIERLTLEKDGVRLRAGFRKVDHSERDSRVGDERYLLFRDNFHFECAAYALAQLLGIDNVPPAVPRRIGNVDGSIQLWVEDLFDSFEGVRSPDAIGWARQVWTMKFFDSLVYNVDRNPGNLKVDHQYRLWMIDHTRAFQHKSSPYELDTVQHVRADVWERLQSLEPEDFEAAFAGLLAPIEIKYFLDRRAALIEHLARLIDERPAGVVIY